ncbi:MAG: hypothetical protein ICV67_04725 [Thermoleophilia bacterium]|nr:hypothetical protein [Thermoleophilia bacterium]
MTTYAVGSSPRIAVRRRAPVRTQLLWLGGGLVLAFIVPYVLADRLDLPRDLYYGLYGAFTVGLFATWARATGQALGEMLRPRLLVAVALGVVFAGVMAAVVLAGDAGTRPEGLELAGALAWRGVWYGLADGLLLSAFPILAVFAAFASSSLRRRVLGKVAIGLVALVASLGMTAAYHAGYSDFRSEKLAKPVAGDVLWSIPTLVTLNPVGAPIAHVGVHVTAVLHDSETDLYLPPHR